MSSKVGHVVNTKIHDIVVPLTNSSVLQLILQVILQLFPISCMRFAMCDFFTYKLFHSSGIIRGFDDSCFTGTWIWMRRHDVYVEVCACVWVFVCMCVCRVVWRMAYGGVRV